MKSLYTITSAAFGLLTLTVLLLNPPQQIMLAADGGALILFGLLTAFALNFGVVVAESELSSAHAVGMLALLAFTREAFSSSLWVIALGSAAGALIYSLHTPQRQTFVQAMFVTGRMALSFYAAALIYPGALPLTSFTIDAVVRVMVYGGIYSAIYFLLFAVEILVEGRGSLPVNLVDVAIVLFVPIPFAALGAVIFTNLSILAFAVYIASLALILIRPQMIARTQKRLRGQVEELRAIAEMGRALRLSLELETLLGVIYQQVQTLIDVEGFTVALYDGTRLLFPLNMQRGQPSTAEPAAVPLRRILESQQPLLLGDDQLPEGVNSWLGVPLLSGGRLLGAMVVTSSDPRRLGDDDVRALNIVASTTSVALENALLYRQQQERVRQLATLNRSLALLNDTLSPDRVIDTVMSAAVALGDSAGAALHLFWDDNNLSVALTRAVGLSDRFRDAPPDPILIADARQQPMSQQPLVIADVERDLRASGLREIMQSEGKAAWIELPLSFQGVGIGVLTLYFDRPREFSPETVELLRTFASQSAQAISNARLYAITDEALERRVGQLLALANIGHHMTAALEVGAICELVADYARETTNSDAAGVVLIDPNGEIEQIAANGYPPGTFGKDRASGIAAQAMRAGTTVVVNDMQSSPDYVVPLAGTRSQMTAPILWNEGVVGVITLESERPNAYSEEDSYFVQQLANQAIIAIENARLFRTISEARDRTQLILNTVKEGLILISATGQVVLANPRVDLVGLTPDALIGSTVDRLLGADNLDLSGRLGFRTASELQRLVKELRSPAGLVPREPKTFTVDDQSEPRFIERQVYPVYDDEQRSLGVLLVFYDETEEMKLAKTREEVSQMLVHDLRSPLTAVNTSLKLLGDLAAKDSKMRPLIETTADTGRRAVRTLLNRVDSLLDVARMENGFMLLDSAPTELATLVDNVCIELSPLTEELSVTLKAEISADLPLLAIDSDKVERVLLNLIDNALKFSPEGSDVTVRAHDPGTEGAALGFLRIDVIDAGPGVPDEYKLLLFDRFIQIPGRTGSRRGTGLGLTFCRLVTETHGGRIWIDDNPSGGSVFSFTLPVAAKTQASAGSD